MIIGTSYFVGKIHLSQVGSSASRIVNNNTSLQAFIDEGEVDVIDMALGKKLSNDFFNQFNSLGVLNTGVDVKWGLLLDGHDYTYGSKEYFWRGLRTKKGALQQSLIANYVYCKYKESSLTDQTTTGTVRADAKNSMIASAIPEIVKSWRAFYEWYMGGDYCHPNISYRRRGLIIDYAGSYNRDVSLYTYLQHQSESFPDIQFTPIENKNQYQL